MAKEHPALVDHALDDLRIQTTGELLDSAKKVGAWVPEIPASGQTNDDWRRQGEILVLTQAGEEKLVRSIGERRKARRKAVAEWVAIFNAPFALIVAIFAIFKHATINTTVAMPPNSIKITLSQPPSSPVPTATGTPGGAKNSEKASGKPHKPIKSKPPSRD